MIGYHYMEIYNYWYSKMFIHIVLYLIALFALIELLLGVLKHSKNVVLFPALFNQWRIKI